LDLDGEGDGEGEFGLDLGFDDDSLESRSDERLDLSGAGLDGGVVCARGASMPVLGVGSGSWSLVPVVGAAPPAAGTRGRTAATGDEPAWSVVENVTTVAAATVVITVAAANLYSFMGCMTGLPDDDGGDDNAIHRSGDSR
jgi:hypothetical protein